MIPALARLVANLKPEQQSSEVRAELRALAQELGQPEARLLDSLAQVVAERFLTRQFTYAEAMARAAHRYDCAFPDLQPERLLYKVYWALDAAEYGLESDPPDEDASEQRCRARVGEVLASCSGTDA